VLPQSAQLAVSISIYASYPFRELSIIIHKPVLHTMLQIPEERRGMPFCDENALPDAPELFKSADKFDQFPEEDVLPVSLSLSQMLWPL
jgi:hypothetical protein